MMPVDTRIFAPLLAVAMGLAQVDCTAAASRYAPATPMRVTERGPAPLRAPKLVALWAHFERQKTPTSCSVASVATVLNTALAATRRPALTQEGLLATQSTGAWLRSTANADTPGVTLDQLALYAMQAFYNQGLHRVAVDVVHMQKVDENARRALERVLEYNNQTEKLYFVIVNFLQSTYTRAGEAVGHMSVVGAYDEAQQRVLVLDVDPELPDPYWVSLDRFVAGMATADDEIGEPRGYLVIREP